MRRQIVGSAAQRRGIGFEALLAQLQQLMHERVNLLLLPDDDLVEFIKQIFREAGFDFQVGESLVGGVRVVHALLDPKSQTERFRRQAMTRRRRSTPELRDRHIGPPL